MAVLTKEEIKKLSRNVYIPCVYTFKNDTKEHLGYIYISSCAAYLKHNNRTYNGVGNTGVKGCAYSWKLYDFEDGRDWLHELDCLTVGRYIMGEI